jgi:hypothetical protein
MAALSMLRLLAPLADTAESGFRAMSSPRTLLLVLLSGIDIVVILHDGRLDNFISVPCYLFAFASLVLPNFVTACCSKVGETGYDAGRWSETGL